MTAQQPNPQQAEFQAGTTAFERGDYRKSVNHLERALALVNPNSVFGGTVQIWLVTAYQAAGQSQAAIALCRTLTHHPDIYTRKECKRILYILEAPQLQTRPEWFVQIPDLNTLADNTDRERMGSQASSSSASNSARSAYRVEPVDLSQVNRDDQGFFWVALVAVLLILAGLIWFM